MVAVKKHAMRAGCKVAWRRRHLTGFAVLQCWFAKAGCTTTIFAPGRDTHVRTMSRGRVEVTFPNGETGTFGPRDLIQCPERGEMTVRALDDDSEWLCLHVAETFGKSKPKARIISLEPDQTETIEVKAPAIVGCVAGSGHINNAIMPAGAFALVAKKTALAFEGYRDGTIMIAIEGGPKK